MQHFDVYHAHIDDDDEGHVDDDIDDDDDDDYDDNCCKFSICTVAWDSLRPVDDKGVDVVKLKKSSFCNVDVA